MKRTLWIIMTAGATYITAYTAAVLLVPGFGPPFLVGRRAAMPLALMAHLGGSLVALGIGAWQMNPRLRSRAIGLHRWMGRAYVVGVLIGGLGGLRMAVGSDQGWVTRLGFEVVALLWLFTTACAYFAIRAHDEVRHRGWMVRSYSLTLAAVTLRIYLPLSLAAGIPFVSAYRLIAWLSWAPNILLAEWLVRRTQAPVLTVGTEQSQATA